MENVKEPEFDRLATAPIKSLVLKLAIPTMIAMAINNIYNMVDTYYVSQISQSASGAVGIVSSLMNVISTIGFTVAIGCSLSISKELGRKNRDQAGVMLSTSFFTLGGIGIILAIIGLTFTSQIMMSLGSTETILPHANAYAFSIFLAAPFSMASFVLNTSLRAQGNSFQSMLGLGSGAIINMFLDPILIFNCGLGVTGAGYSTAISQIASFCILLYQSNFNEKCISVEFSKVKPSVDLYKELIKTGFPNFCRQSLATASSIILNVLANPYGDAAIAAISIVSRVIMLVTSLVHGFGQGFQAVAGYNFSAKKYSRVLESLWYTIKVGVIITTTFALVGFVFSEQIISLFRKGDMEVISIGVFMLKAYSITLPLVCISNISTMIAQCTGYSVRASFIAASRQGICFIPIVFLFSSNLGLLGLQIAQPVAEIFAVIFSVCVVKGVIKDITRLREIQNHQQLTS